MGVILAHRGAVVKRNPMRDLPGALEECSLPPGRE
jgi:hypothetical protein